MIRKCLPYEPYQNYYACLGKYIEFDGRYFRGIDEPPHVAYETELKKKYGKNYKGLVMDGWFFKKLGVKYPTTAEEWENAVKLMRKNITWKIKYTYTSQMYHWTTYFLKWQDGEYKGYKSASKIVREKNTDRGWSERYDLVPFYNGIELKHGDAPLFYDKNTRENWIAYKVRFAKKRRK